MPNVEDLEDLLVDVPPEPYAPVADPESPLRGPNVGQHRDVSLLLLSQLPKRVADPCLGLLVEALQILLGAVGDVELPAQCPSSFMTSSSVCTRPAATSSRASRTASSSSGVTGSSS